MRCFVGFQATLLLTWIPSSVGFTACLFSALQKREFALKFGSEGDDASLLLKDETIESYNSYMERIAHSDPEKVDELFQRMISVDYPTPEPTEETYATAMEAWSHQKKPERALEILRMTTNNGNEPSTKLYNKMIRTYGMSGQPEKAEELFRELGDHVNYKSWYHLIKSYVVNNRRRRKKHPYAQKVRSLYQEMQESKIQPDTQIDNLLLQTLSHADAEAHLYQMMISEAPDSAPDAETFRCVIQSFYGATEAAVASKIEKLLELCPAVDPKTWSTALKVVARTRDAKKAQKAQRFLEQLESPTIYNYQNVLAACAYTPQSAEPEHKLRALQIAMEVFNAMPTPRPSLAYALTLRACALMPSSPKRDGMVKTTFELCCEEGLVDTQVAEEFGRVASPQLQLELLGGFAEDGIELPSEWSSNVETSSN